MEHRIVSDGDPRTIVAVVQAGGGGDAGAEVQVDDQVAVGGLNAEGDRAPVRRAGEGLAGRGRSSPVPSTTPLLLRRLRWVLGTDG